MKPNFSDEVRQDMLDVYNGYCCVKNCLHSAIEFHHKVSNTKVNQRRLPLFLQSPFNCAPVCREHHDKHSQYPELNIGENLAQIYEDWLVDMRLSYGGIDEFAK